MAWMGSWGNGFRILLMFPYVLKLLLTVQNGLKFTNINPDREKIAIFETTGKNSVSERWGVTPHLQYGKKIKKFDRKFAFSQKSEKPVFLCCITRRKSEDETSREKNQYFFHELELFGGRHCMHATTMTMVDLYLSILL